MPWKTHPTTGIIVGYVRDLNGNPLTDAYVKIDGDSYTYLSSGDGFYSIVDAMPGTRTLQASKNMYGRDGRQVELAAGQVIQVDFLEPRAESSDSIDPSTARRTIHISLRIMILPIAHVTIQAIERTEQTPEVVTPRHTTRAGAFAGSIILPFGPPARRWRFAGRAAIRHFHLLRAFDGTGPSTSSNGHGGCAIVIFENFRHNPG
jgi:hypothetical protein